MKLAIIELKMYGTCLRYEAGLTHIDAPAKYFTVVAMTYEHC